MLDLLRILMKWRRPLLAATLVAGIVAAVVALRLTPRYYAEASVLPPPDEPGMGGLSALLQQYQVPIPGGTSTPFLPTLYASIVSSRRMGKSILDEFELRPVLGTRTETDALGALRGRTSLRYTDDGLFLVGYEDPDPRRAAEVTNAYVRHLDEFIRLFNSGRAAQTRTFIEGQIARCRTDLERAEEALRDFQQQHHAVQIDTQTEGAIQIAAELQGRILAAEVELDVLRQRALPTSQEVRLKTQELAALRASYSQLGGGGDRALDAPGAGGGESVFPRFGSVPDLALQYLRLMRDLKVQEALNALLTQQLEQARIEEQKNTTVLSVLDWADTPEMPVFPRKLLLVAISMLATAVWVALVAVLVEKLRERRADADEAARLTALRREWDRMPPWVRALERLVTR